MKKQQVLVQAREDVRKVYDTPELRIRDFTAEPCSRRVGVPDRYAKRVATLRDKLNFDADRLDAKLRAIAPNDLEYQAEILRAQTVLRAGAEEADRLVRSARTVRRWARQSCKVR